MLMKVNLAKKNLSFSAKNERFAKIWTRKEKEESAAVKYFFFPPSVKDYNKPRGRHHFIIIDF